MSHSTHDGMRRDRGAAHLVGTPNMMVMKLRSWPESHGKFHKVMNIWKNRHQALQHQHMIVKNHQASSTSFNYKHPCMLRGYAQTVGHWLTARFDTYLDLIVMTSNTSTWSHFVQLIYMLLARLWHWFNEPKTFNQAITGAEF